MRDAEATRRALKQAGEELFARRGFDAVRVEEIARAARVNKAMINYHFGGKAKLYRAILGDVFSAALRELEILRESPGPADQLLLRYLEIFNDLHRRRPALSAMILREILGGGRHLDESLLPPFLAIFETVRILISRGIREGRLRRVDPFLTHLTLAGVLTFFHATAPFRSRILAERRLAVEPPSPEKFLAHLKDLLTRGILERAEAVPTEQEPR